jgi:cellulose synthase/poly-beta-1,6-N-acetylglucosamine synthase-like glycosyltransferase
VPNLTTFAVPSHGLHASPPASRAGVRLAVLVPTRNEAANIETLLERTGAAVAGIPTEVVFVDDSDDDTPAAIRAAARRTAGGAFQVSLIHRQGSQRSGAWTGPSWTACVTPRWGSPSPTGTRARARDRSARA